LLTACEGIRESCLEKLWRYRNDGKTPSAYARHLWRPLATIKLFDYVTGLKEHYPEETPVYVGREFVEPNAVDEKRGFCRGTKSRNKTGRYRGNNSWLKIA